MHSISMIWFKKLRYTGFIFAMAMPLLYSSEALAQAFIVDSMEDKLDVNPGDGICATDIATCTLRAAVQETNALPGADVISLPAGNYLFSSALAQQDFTNGGHLNITDHLVIIGEHQDSTIIDTGSVDRAFTINQNIDVHIRNLSIINGASTNYSRNSGSAIYNAGRLSVRAVTVSNNGRYAAGDGSAIDNQGKMILDNVTVTNNTALLLSDGVINNDSLMTIRNSDIISNNTQLDDAAGINNSGALYVMDSNISGNDNGVSTLSDRQGAAIYSSYGQAVVLLNSTVNDNIGGTSSRGTGGAIYVSGGKFYMWGTSVSGNTGGALELYGTDAYLNGAIFADNTGTAISATESASNNLFIADQLTITNNTGDHPFGGSAGIYADKTIKIINSTITNNVSPTGAGIYLRYNPGGEPSLVSHSLIANNTSTDGDGGGIYSEQSVNLFNVTLSGNSITSDRNLGGGLFVDLLGDATLTNVTLANNSANGGFGANLSSDGGDIILSHTIIANPVASGNCDAGLSADIISNGYNIASDATCFLNAAGDQPSVDPMLADLADNGGPTLTHALTAGSPAIDGGSTACESTDQRGLARADGACDIGAYENAAAANNTGTIEFTADAFYAQEGSLAVATINIRRLDSTSGNASVGYMLIPGSASSGSTSLTGDYQDTTGQLTWADGDSDIKSITVKLNNDLNVEPNKYFTVALIDPSIGATIGTQSMTKVYIVDTDATETQLQFSTAVSVTDENAGLATIQVERTGGITGTASADIVVVNGTATEGRDYDLPTTHVDFTDGELFQTVTLSITADSEDEGNEFVQLGLSNLQNIALGDNANHTLTIIGNNNTVATQAINFEHNTVELEENAGTAILTVIRSQGTGSVSVDFAVTGGTATSGDDFLINKGVSNEGTLQFSEGEVSKTIDLTVINDTEQEDDETILITLTNPLGHAVIGDVDSTTVTVLANDDPTIQPGEINFEQASYTVDETSGVLTIKVNRTMGSDGEVSATINLSGSATNMEDYRITSTNITFADQENNKDIIINPIPDTVNDPDETIILSLQDPQGGADIGTTPQTIITITDVAPIEAPPTQNDNESGSGITGSGGDSGGGIPTNTGDSGGGAAGILPMVLLIGLLFGRRLKQQ